MYEKANLLFTCKLNECNLYLEDGVTLPCGYTICKYHLNPFLNQTFKCSFCFDQHLIPKNDEIVDKK